MAGSTLIRHTLFAVTLGLVIFFLYLFQYTGAFRSVEIAQDTRGPYTVIFAEHIGVYHHIVKKIESVEKWAREQGFSCRLSFGEFFDNPRLTEEGRLRSRGGCLIDTSQPQESALYEKVKTQLPAEFKTAVIPASPAVVALFTGAPGIGPLKVYPKAEDYMAENRLIKKTNVIEIYEIFNKNSMQTTYIWPLESP
jgi:hypothetical protein